MFKPNLASLRPLAALTAGILVGAVLSSLSSFASGSPIDDFGTGRRGYHPSHTPDPEAEITPEELAAELGLPQNEGEPFSENSGFSKKIPTTRVVPPSQFANYRVNLDIFRKSTRRPVLGEYRSEYAAALVPNSEGMSAEEIEREAKKRFARLAAKEFAILSVDGVPTRAYIVSAGIEQKIPTVVKNPDGSIQRDEFGNAVTRLSKKTTPPGNYRLDALVRNKSILQPDGTRKTQVIANPWLRSSTYQNSQMFWGLWIKGGYFIHSTPHYGQLGQLASMGCIRQSFPDAQALFKLIVEDDMTGMIRIHALGSTAAVSRLREVVLDLGYTAPESAPVAAIPTDPTKDMVWLVGQLQSSAEQIREMIAYYGPELEMKGHSWIDSETGRPAATTWPICTPSSENAVDCFKAYGVRKPKNSLN